jgi:hypothetical protein
MVSTTPCPLHPPDKRRGTHCTGGTVGLRAGTENLTSTGFLTPDILACSESVYQLQYPSYPEVLNRDQYNERPHKVYSVF